MVNKRGEESYLLEASSVSNGSSSLVESLKVLEVSHIGHELEQTKDGPDTEPVSLRQWLSRLSPRLYMLIFLAAISYWLLLNGLHAEEPLLVLDLPEGQAVPSYMVLLEQIGVLAGGVFVACHHLTSWRPSEWRMVAVFITVSLVTALPLAFLWDSTTLVGNQPHSLVLFIMVIILGIVSNLSSVVYPTLMSYFKPQYISSLYLGQASSSMVTGLVGLLQGVGETKCFNNSETKTVMSTSEPYTSINVTYFSTEVVNFPPRFSVTVYFIILTCILCMATICFAIIYFHPGVRSEWWPDNEVILYVNKNENTDNKESTGSKQTKLLDADKNNTSPTKTKHTPSTNIISKAIQLPGGGLSPVKRGLWFCVAFWYGSMIRSLPNSINSYVFLPYGTVTYGVAVRGAYVAKTVASFSVLFLHLRIYTAIIVLLLVASAIEIFFFNLALCSPTPPLSGELSGSAMVVSTQKRVFVFYYEITDLYTQNICITFVQCWTNVEDGGRRFTNGKQMFRVCWVAI